MSIATNSRPAVIQPLGRRNARCARGCGHRFAEHEITCETLQGDICLSCITDVEMRRSMEVQR